jgi:hypothetical protein
MSFSIPPTSTNSCGASRRLTEPRELDQVAQNLVSSDGLALHSPTGASVAFVFLVVAERSR